MGNAMKERREKMQSFLRGFGSVLDLGGTSFRSQPTFRRRESDGAALKSDWEAIGRDFRKAMNDHSPNYLRDNSSAVH